MCAEQRENSFCLYLWVFVKNNVKIHCFDTIMTLATSQGRVHTHAS